MIYYFKPYSITGKLFTAYDEYAQLVSKPDDWICFLDGDVLFLVKDWGHVIQRYTEKYPDAGMFTCYASRCSYQGLIPKEGKQTNTDLMFHIKIARGLHAKHSGTLAVKTFNRRTAGHLLLIKKSIWERIREPVGIEVQERKKKILGVDTAISRAVLALGKDILVMRALYLLHLFRLDGRKYTRV